MKFHLRFPKLRKANSPKERVPLTAEQKLNITFRNQVKRDKNYHLLMTSLAMVLILTVGSFVLSHFNSVRAILGNYNDISYQIAVAKPSEFASAPSVNNTLQAALNVGLVDVRAFVLDQYFLENQSPLYGTGKIFVETCDRLGAPKDCRVVAAIARAETDLCKYHTSASYYNCWGFGGAGPHRIYFKSWEESINRVTNSLVNSYGLEYMINPSLMERTFCGWEPGCTGWGNRVKYHMKIIDEYPLKLGFNFKLTDIK